MDCSDVLEDDEKYWKENYTDTPWECHYCKDGFEYLAKKGDKEVRFCKKHYQERVEMEGTKGPFCDYIFKWVGNK